MKNRTDFHILVRAPNWIGDQVLAYPFFYYLRKAYPKAHITSVCVPWVKELQYRDLVNDVQVLPRPSRDTLFEKFSVTNAFAKKLKAEKKWDLAFALPNSISSAWLIYRAGAKQRLGYKFEGRGILLTEGSDIKKTMVHRAQSYVDLLPIAVRPTLDIKDFWGIPAENDLDEDIPGEQSAFNPRKSWPDFPPIPSPTNGEPYWVLAPGATADSRRWPVDYFIALVERIQKETGLVGVIVGGPSEAPLAARLCDDSKLRLIDATAQCPVPGLSEIFRNAEFTVCNESGLAHVAALCGSFVQIVCGAADPRRTQPLGPGRVQVNFNPVDCWPCERNTCSQPSEMQFQCLRGIKPDSVWEEIRRGTKS